IQNEPRVRSVDQIDLMRLPLPDLAVEIDITSSSLDRFEIYQALGVPEVWRYDGKTLEINHLQADGYEVRSHSRAIPMLSATDILRFLELRFSTGENSLIKRFRQWVRDQQIPEP
ncbi:MAG: Uma2 family endonuclease, partial [Leptolyngbya sp. SIO4C1]|nr:Uma2 family endonuclease [Leptolyngbya sp. SIO4C1]